MQNKTLGLAVIAAFLGLLDASYLTIKHYSGELVACTTKGCEIVLTSKYAELQGFPLSLLGAVYYLTVMVLFILHWDLKSQKLLKTLAILTAVGVLISTILVCLQLFVIKAICLYCMFSAVINLSLAIITIKAYKRLRVDSQEINQN